MNWSDWSQASWNADSTLKIIDGLMAYASGGRGKPPAKEKALYLSSVSFAYAVWENFVEELAIELVTALGDALRPNQLNRPAVRDLIEKNASVWDLSVFPGWQQLWVTRVSELAKGTDDGGWGLNTANYKNCRKLFEVVGIGPIPKDCETRLNTLVALRGEIVHTASTTEPLYKKEVGEWKAFVTELVSTVDTDARAQCENWVNS